MTKKTFWLLAALALPFALTGCSDDEPAEGPSNENSAEDVDFTVMLQPITRASVIEENGFKEFRLYSVGPWSKSKWGSTSGEAIPYKDVKRNKDDADVWDYSPKIQWSWMNSSQKATFFAVANAAGAKYKVKSNGSYNVNGDFGVKTTFEPFYTNDYNLEKYYHSEEMNDVVMAKAYDCTKDEFYKKRNVDLNFVHILPRVVLRAALADESLEASVQESYLIGVKINGTYNIKGSNALKWTYPTTSWQEFIEMKLSKTVYLNTTEWKPLVDAGCEPHVVPQTVKGWKSIAYHDGVGIALYAKVKSKLDNSYLVGSASEYDYIYLPIDNMTFESNHIYDVNISFGAHYDDNGRPKGFNMKYGINIVNWGDGGQKTVDLKIK